MNGIASNVTHGLRSIGRRKPRSILLVRSDAAAAAAAAAATTTTRLNNSSIKSNCQTRASATASTSNNNNNNGDDDVHQSKSMANNNNNNNNNTRTTTTTTRRSLEIESPNRWIWVFRILFLLLLIGMAIALGFLGFSLVSNSEQELAEQQYEALADRTLEIGTELALRRRVVIRSMGQIAASAFPNVEQWPDVAIPAFETFAQDIIRTSDSLELGFYPKVEPHMNNVSSGEQASFEQFAYDYLYHQRSPPFPNTTAKMSWGRGIWNAKHNHDLDGKTIGWESPHQVLFPELQNSIEGDNGGLFLMFNIHSSETKGRPLDDVLDCAYKRKIIEDHEIDCAVVTQVEQWNRASYLIHPIYPANNPLELTGVIVSKVSWDVILQRMFANTVASGLVAIMQSEGKSYSYHVENGKAVYLGEGDLHDARYQFYAHHVVLEGTTISGISSRTYELILYPTQDFFEIYSTSSPFVVMIGAVLIVVATSLVFLVYDRSVRREFTAKQQLLQAKRAFMRFISHEVRTPLNATCLGLKLLQDEVEVATTRAAKEEETLSHLPLPSAHFLSQQMSTNMDSRSEADSTAGLSMQVYYDGVAQISKGRGLPGLWETPSQSSGDNAAFEYPNGQKKKTAAGTTPVHIPLQRPGRPCCIGRKEELEGWLELIQEIFSSATSSVDVLNDLLNYDKIETNTLSLEYSVFPIQNLLEEISHEFRLSAKKKKVHFDIVTDGPWTKKIDPSNPNLRLVADRIRITQVLRNLISNAIKFTPENGTVSIKLSMSKSIGERQRTTETYSLVSGEEISCCQEGTVEIDVMDTGAGMTSHQLEKLGREGVQFNVNQLQAGRGSGLGLFISRGIVESHGGLLAVSSGGLGLGTTFTCSLPLYNVPITDVEEPSDEIRPSHSVSQSKDESFKSLQVLVVDDVATNRKLLSRVVAKRGHATEEACDGREAVTKVVQRLREGRRYDTILLDYEMPVMKGPEAAKEIREVGCDSLIVGITGNLFADDVLHFTSCGADHVLPKPVDIHKLEELWFEHGIVTSSC